MKFNFEIDGNPKDLKALALRLQELTREIGQVFEENESLLLVETNVAPDKPENGRLYFADGSDWDPGSGRGCYMYDAVAVSWRLLG